MSEPLARRHLAAGWTALFVFVLLGATLEALLAWKAPALVDSGIETRRTLWRLAHAHGTGLALVQIAYGLTVQAAPRAADGLASGCLLAAMGLVPLGFFAGGISVHGVDPGIGVLLVPPGAVALLVGAARIAASLLRRA